VDDQHRRGVVVRKTVHLGGDTYCVTQHARRLAVSSSEHDRPMETRPQASAETRPQTPPTDERGAVQDLLINAGGSAIGTGLGTYAVGKLKPNADPSSPPPAADNQPPPPSADDADWNWPKS
jgi:hypothetical protein